LRALADLTPAPDPQAAAIIAAAASEPDADGPEARAVMGRVTVNLGRIAAGASSNLVPAQAEAGLDIRIPLGLSVAAVEAEIDRILARRPGVEATVTRRYEPSWTDPDAAVARACLSAAGRVLERPAFPDMRIGGSDARLWRRAGFETVVHGLTPCNLGAPDENLHTEELWRLLAIQAIAAREFLSYGAQRA
jgi:succinyl-diaminopimelate desuccinylase